MPITPLHDRCHTVEIPRPGTWEAFTSWQVGATGVAEEEIMVGVKLSSRTCRRLRRMSGQSADVM